MSSEYNNNNKKINTIKLLEEAKKHVFSSIDVGTETLVSLDNQDEILDSIEENMTKNDEVLGLSGRYLRGMTWTGSLYNTYTDLVGYIGGNSSKTENISKNQNDHENYKIAEVPPPLPTNDKENLLNLKRQAFQQEINLEDQMLDEIYLATQNLKDIGETMKVKLTNQTSKIEEIDEKSEKLQAKTLAVTVKTSKLNNYYDKDPGKYIGTYQFIFPENMSILAIEGENLILSNCADKACLFNCFVRQNTVFGIQSCLSDKFLGTTIWGGIAVSGNYFGGSEESFFDLSGKETGILIIQRNWGSGGWLKKPISNSETILNIPITQTTTSIDDKKDILLVTAMKIN